MNIRRLKNIVTKKIKAEITPDLKYHGLEHVLSVYRVCNDYVKRLQIDAHSAWLLRTAALTHDIGIYSSYTDHEAAGIKYIHQLLPTLGYSKKDLTIISDMISATKIPQSPKSLLEQIICDADLDYLGTHNFYSIGHTLYEEFLSRGVIKNEKEWDLLQINFLQKHNFHTDFAKKNREPVKRQYVKELKHKWNIE